MTSPWASFAMIAICVTFAGIHSDGKFHLLPTGELLIHNLEYNDRFPSYRCRTMHRLTRQVVASSSAKVRINGEYFHFSNLHMQTHPHPHCNRRTEHTIQYMHVVRLTLNNGPMYCQHRYVFILETFNSKSFRCEFCLLLFFCCRWF